MLKITADRLIKGDILKREEDNKEIRVTRVEKVKGGIHLDYDVLDSDGVRGGVVLHEDTAVEVLRHGY